MKCIICGLVEYGTGEILKIKSRPHLKEFLKYVFENFESVSIWTAATEKWYFECFEEGIQDYMPSGYHFDFVITREDNFIDDTCGYPKLLSKVYEVHEKYTQTNTMIIDDNPLTYKYNVLNAIPIKPFDIYDPNHVNDDELLKIIELFKRNSFTRDLI